jgi:hypothetical protein
LAGKVKRHFAKYKQVIASQQMLNNPDDLVAARLARRLRER